MKLTSSGKVKKKGSATDIMELVGLAIYEGVRTAKSSGLTETQTWSIFTKLLKDSILSTGGAFNEQDYYYGKMDSRSTNTKGT